MRTLEKFLGAQLKKSNPVSDQKQNFVTEKVENLKNCGWVGKSNLGNCQTKYSLCVHGGVPISHYNFDRKGSLRRCGPGKLWQRLGAGDDAVGSVREEHGGNVHLNIVRAWW